MESFSEYIAEQADKTVTILRGISGAGKSTYIQKHLPHAVVASADHFFGHGANYKFNPSKLKDAHAFSFSTFRKAVEAGEPSIVVDNTNTQLWEFERYINFAKQHGYKVHVVRLSVDPKVAAERNVHGVPAETILKMQQRFQNFPGEHIQKS